MKNQQPREQFEAELRRQRLPRAYIERLLTEWDDHIQDLQEERSHDMARTPEIVNFEDRLGNPAQLAAIAAKQYHNRSFLGRHPLLTFVVLPIPIIVLGIATVVLATFLLDYVFDWFCHGFDMYDYPYAEYLTGTIFFWLLIVFPPLSAVLLLCRVARRNAVSWRWTVAACLTAAFYCALLYVTWLLPSRGYPHTRIAIGLIIPFYTPTTWNWFFTRCVPQFLLALSVGVLLVKRAQQLQKLNDHSHDVAPLREAA